MAETLSLLEFIQKLFPTRTACATVSPTNPEQALAHNGLADLTEDDVHDALVLADDSQTADFSRNYDTGGNSIDFSAAPTLGSRNCHNDGDDGDSDGRRHKAAVEHLAALRHQQLRRRPRHHRRQLGQPADRHRRRRLRPGHRHRLHTSPPATARWPRATTSATRNVITGDDNQVGNGNIRGDNNVQSATTTRSCTATATPRRSATATRPAPSIDGDVSGGGGGGFASGSGDTDIDNSDNSTTSTDSFNDRPLVNDSGNARHRRTRSRTTATPTSTGPATDNDDISTTPIRTARSRTPRTSTSTTDPSPAGPSLESRSKPDG